MKNTEEKLIKYRRLFHRYPEPGWLTFFATIYLADHLERAGYEVHVGREVLGDELLMDPPDPEQIESYERLAFKFARESGIKDGTSWLRRMDHKTGLVAVMNTGRKGPVKAYRFDMDALAIQESCDEMRNPVRQNFVSRNSGVSHACGHDGHMALGLTLAETLAEEKETLKGKYIFIFQPAEEGVRGAVAFCHQWKYGGIDQLYCCHIGYAPEHVFVAGAKGFLATAKFDVRFQGKSAHAGLAPERGRNALLAAADAVVRMQEIRRPAGGVTRLNVGQMKAGEARNTIPAKARMKAETRGETARLNQYMKEQALECVEKAARKYGVQYEVIFQGESVSAASDPELAEKVLEAARRSGGFEQYISSWDFGASDDGAVFMDMVQKQGGQAVYMLFGTEINGMQHEPAFDFSEQVLIPACRVLYETAVS